MMVIALTVIRHRWLELKYRKALIMWQFWKHHLEAIDNLYPGFKVDKQRVHINPTLLFSRLIAILQREDNMASYFDYELTTVPTSLFEDNRMRKPVKAQLAKALTISVQPSERSMKQCMFLMVGPFFIGLKWAKKAT